MKTFVVADGLLFVGTNRGKVAIFQVGNHHTDSRGSSGSSGSDESSDVHGVLECGETYTDSPLLSLCVGRDEESGRLLLFATFENKQIYGWDVATRRLMGSCTARKKVTAMICSTIEHPTAGRKLALIVSDKAGDIWAFDACKLGNISDVTNGVSDSTAVCSRVYVAGHTASVITDMIQVPRAPAISNPRYVGAIVSCDRDEKIRISRFPQLESVEGYCLGHTSVVTSVVHMILDDTLLLLSCGWDRKLFLWDASSCAVLAELECCTTEDKQKFEDQQPKQFEPQTEAVDISNTKEATDGEDIDSGNAEDGTSLVHADGNDEDVFEKTYDENANGSFPVKIVSITGSSLFAVFFRNSVDLHIYEITRKQPSSTSSSSQSSTSFGITPLTVVYLPRVPVDVVIVNSTADGNVMTLLILFDDAVEFKAYDVVHGTDHSIEVREGSSINVWAQVNNSFVTFCKDNGEHTVTYVKLLYMRS
jgi:WD40 repeat protein